jgi:hypothetical protein
VPTGAALILESHRQLGRLSGDSPRYDLIRFMVPLMTPGSGRHESFRTGVVEKEKIAHRAERGNPKSAGSPDEQPLDLSFEGFKFHGFALMTVESCS